MEVMTVKDTTEQGNYKYSLMGKGDEITHVHVNNIHNNNNSVIIPISVLQELFHDNSC